MIIEVMATWSGNRPEAKPDVKCLHAQVADELVRNGGNLIAQQVLRDIEDRIVCMQILFNEKLTILCKLRGSDGQIVRPTLDMGNMFRS